MRNPANLGMHLTYSYSSDLEVRTWCGKLVHHDFSFGLAMVFTDRDGRRIRDEVLALVTCEKCLNKKREADDWSTEYWAHFQKFEEAQDPEPRRRAWIETTAARGENRYGFLIPKRIVEITEVRNRLGHMDYVVYAPEGFRFPSNLVAGVRHAETHATEESAEQTRELIALERCPEDCTCKTART